MNDTALAQQMVAAARNVNLSTDAKLREKPMKSLKLAGLPRQGMKREDFINRANVR